MTPKRFFFVICGIIVALLAAGGTGYWFALQAVRTSSVTLATDLGRQASLTEQLTDLARLKVQYDRDITPILPQIDQALPRGKNQTEILAQLQSVAAQSGLAISGATFPASSGLPSAVSQTTKVGQVLALPVSFDIQGPYAKLKAFLVRVENLNRFTNVTSLAVSRADKGDTVTFAMTVTVYVKP